VTHPRLVGVRAKLDRAQKHVDELNETANGWRESHAKPMIRVERDGDWEVAFLQHEQVPPVIPVIAGDVVHNMRSALDHLAWLLVDGLSNGKASSDTYFPILTDKKEFRSRVWEPRKDKRGRARGPLVGIPLNHPVLKVIESHQPYMRVDSDSGRPPEMYPLAILNTLWNVDKHRTLHTIWIATKDPSKVLEVFKWNPAATMLKHRIGKELATGTLEEDKELVRYLFDPASRSKPHLYAEGDIPAYVTIGYSKKPPGLSVRVGAGGWPILFKIIEELLADTERFL
jgi:hypothetical protein